MVVDRTGTLRRGVGRLVKSLEGRDRLVIPLVSLVFAAGGALINMGEEIIALVPVLLVLSNRMGYRPLVAAAISLGPAIVGASFGPANPFQAVISRQIAELPLLSGSAVELSLLAVCLTVWIIGTMRYAARTRPEAAAVAGSVETDLPLGGRGLMVLLIVLLTFAVFVYGVVWLEWGFDEMSALFLTMGVLAGIVGGLGVTGTAEAFAEGFMAMAPAAIMVGLARAISYVLGQGAVIDTIVHGLAIPLSHLPAALAAVGMVPVQALIHLPVPSVSGQAVLTLPVLVPLSDLLGLSRQATVLAYQIGAGLCELLTPTNGALMAVLAAAGVRYEDWLRFVTPLYGIMVGLGIVGLIVAVALG